MLKTEFMKLINLGKGDEVVVNGDRLRQSLLQEQEQANLLAEQKLETMYDREEELMAINAKQQEKISELRDILASNGETIKSCLNKTKDYENISQSLNIQTALNAYRQMSKCSGLIRVEL